MTAQKIILTVGLPASGKSFWAKQYCKDNPGWKRINKDDLRVMLDDSKWSKRNEQFILKMRDMILLKALEDGYSLIIDDTNFATYHLERIKKLAENIPIEVNDSFLQTPLSVCLKRDKNRIGKVGRNVILGMWKRYIAKPDEKAPSARSFSPVPKFNNPAEPNKKRCIICDLDGTLALHNGRSPYNATYCQTDLVNHSLAWILEASIADLGEHSPGLDIIYLTGREEKYRQVTEQWLDANALAFHDMLLMRPSKDQRTDSIVKKEIYYADIEPYYEVVAVFEDRLRVCEMWHEEKLPVYRVGDPNARY